MTKPWEETWEAEAHGNACECSSRVRLVGDSTEGGELFFANDGARAVAMHARLKLAAAAPEMARMLDRLEWTANLGQNTYGCGICSREVSRTAKRSEHYPDCELLALLRKAGVRE